MMALLIRSCGLVGEGGADQEIVTVKIWAHPFNPSTGAITSLKFQDIQGYSEIGARGREGRMETENEYG